MVAFSDVLEHMEPETRKGGFPEWWFSALAQLEVIGKAAANSIQDHMSIYPTSHMHLKVYQWRFELLPISFSPSTIPLSYASFLSSERKT